MNVEAGYYVFQGVVPGRRTWVYKLELGTRPTRSGRSCVLRPMITIRGATVAKDFRFRNFDTIRLVAAVSVIFSHAFLISDGHVKMSPSPD